MRGGDGAALLQRDNINRLQLVGRLAVRGGGSVDAGAGTGVLQREGFLVRGIIGGQSFSDGSRGGISVLLGVEDFQIVFGSVRIVILGNEALAGGTAAAGEENEISPLRCAPVEMTRGGCGKQERVCGGNKRTGTPFGAPVFFMGSEAYLLMTVRVSMISAKRWPKPSAASAE